MRNGENNHLVSRKIVLIKTKTTLRLIVIGSVNVLKCEDKVKQSPPNLVNRMKVSDHPRVCEGWVPSLTLKLYEDGFRLYHIILGSCRQSVNVPRQR